jgi:lambda repressor-like predicted transcriptional regulator
MSRTWATKLFDRNPTAEMLIAVGLGAKLVWGARHAERNFAPSLNVNAPLT